MNIYISQTRTLFCILIFSILFLTSCSKEDEKDPIAEILPPIELPCDYFNQDRILENDPNRPVDYLIDCWTRVEAGLKIEPGVVIAFEYNAGMFITLGNKIFEAKGTFNDPIVFTGTSENAGHWRGLFFTEAYNTNNVIEHAKIRYAGSQNLTTSSPIYEGSIAVRGVSGTTPQSLTLNHVEISNSGNIGLDLHGIGAQATVEVSNLTIKECQDVPIKISANKVHILDETSHFEGNVLDFVNITPEHNSIETSNNWNKLDVPYLVDGRVRVIGGGHLIIKEGVEIQFQPQGYIQVSPNGTDYNLSLKILGTEENPVHLKAANGTNWGGIYYGFTQQDNLITHAIIEHAKGDFPVGNIVDSGAIYMHANPKLSVSNTTFKDLPNFAFYAYTGASNIKPDPVSYTHLTLPTNREV